VAVAGLAFWLRVVQIGESLWLDELHTSWVVADGAQQLAPRSAVGNQSPAYFALVWSVTRVAGASEFWLRLPSVLAGVALAVGAHLVIVRWTACWSAGLLAAVLVALDRNCVFYGQEARTYALVQLVGLLHVGLFVELLRRPAAQNQQTPTSVETEATNQAEPSAAARLPGTSQADEHGRLAWRLGWIATGVLLFYLHYTAILLLAGEIVYYASLRVVLRRRAADAADPGAAPLAGGSGRQAGYPWRQLALDVALLGLCLLPAAPHLREIVQRRENWSSFVAPRSLWRIWEIGDVFPLDVYLAAPLVVLAAALISERILRRSSAPAASSRCREGRWFLLVLCWLLAPLAIAWFATAQGYAPLFFRRYLIVAAVAPMLWAALCYAACPSRAWRVLCAAGVVAAVIYQGGLVRQWRHDGRVVGDRNQDWRSAVAHVNGPAGDNAPVFVRSGLIEAEQWYASGDPLRREFCLLPVLGLYRLARPVDQLFPLPVRPAAVLSAEAQRRVLAARNAWCLVQGSEASQAQFEASLRKAWQQAGVPVEGIQRRSFGSVGLFHVRLASPERPGAEAKQASIPSPSPSPRVPPAAGSP